MRIFTVYRHPAPADPDQGVVFVKEGYAWWCLIAPVIWFAFHRLWLGIVLFLGIATGLAAGLQHLGYGTQIQAGVVALFQVLVAAHANDLRRSVLAAQGYVVDAIVAGRNEEEAEARYFAESPHVVQTLLSARELRGGRIDWREMAERAAALPVAALDRLRGSGR